MKKLFYLLLFSAFTVNSISAQNGASLEFKLTSSKGMTGTMKIFYSSPGSRMEMNMVVPQMPGGGFSKTTLVKSDKPGTVYTLDDKNKTYTSTEVVTSGAAATDNITVKVIGKEKVASYNCTHVMVTKGTEASEYWTTKEIADLEKYSKYNRSNRFTGSDAEQAALAKNGADGFIIKSITKDQRGGDMTMELVKLEKKDLPATLFEIPADYKGGALPAAAPMIDAAKLQSMTPEERAKYIEEMKAKYGTQTGK
jgi:hypothetical protein